MSGGFTATYTDEQRDALGRAFQERGIRPASRVVALAEAGELEPGLAAFAVVGGAGTVRTYASRLRKRQAGALVSELAAAPPQDAIEALRRRMVNLVESMLTDAERARKRGELKPADIGQLGRALRELAAIPGPHDARPTQPGERTPGRGTLEGKTRTGPAAAMLADMAGHASLVGPPETAAPDPPVEATTETDGTTDDEGAQRHDGHSWLSDRIAEVATPRTA